MHSSGNVLIRRLCCFRRSLHVSAAVSRARRPFFNIHKKVTDPARQDPEYFEKAASALPLGTFWITIWLFWAKFHPVIQIKLWFRCDPKLAFEGRRAMPNIFSQISLISQFGVICACLLTRRLVSVWYDNTALVDSKFESLIFWWW